MKKMEIRDDDGSLAAARRRPTQARSRERVERMLAAAADLIARKGSEQVRMQEVATQAGVSLASLYQFFPDKSALIRTLAERYNAESRRCIVEALANVSDLDSLLAAYSSLVDQYFEIVMAEPAMRDIWSGMQADKQLAAVHLTECRTQGQFLADALCKAFPQLAPDEAARRAFLIWELGEATIRLAISAGQEEGRALVEIFKHMTLREIASS